MAIDSMAAVPKVMDRHRPSGCDTPQRGSTGLTSRNQSWLTLFARLAVLVGFVALFFLSGCASKPVPTTTVRMAVLDGLMVNDVRPGGEVERLGWWFGSRDRYTASNVGVLFGDIFHREFSRLPGLDVYSRDDYIVYLAQKERLLRRGFPELTSQARKRVLAQMDPVDYGRSLNVDYVLHAEILEAATTTNLTISSWWSELNTRASLYDVKTGEVVVTMDFDRTRNFRSQVALMEEFARRSTRRFLRDDPIGIYGR